MQNNNNQYQHVPQELRPLKAWLIWKFVHIPGENKPRKIPMYANGQTRKGTQGSTEDREGMVTFDGAVAAAKKFNAAGIGFATFSEFGIVALDFDDCITNGAVHSEVFNIVKNTYAEVSPSGRGIRAFMSGELRNKKSHAENGRYGFEVFHSNGFVTVTGRMLKICYSLGTGKTLKPLTSEVMELYESRFGKKEKVQKEKKPQSPRIYNEDISAPKVGLSINKLESYLSMLDPSIGHDEWLKVLMAVHHETDGSDEGFEICDKWSSGGIQYPGTDEVRKRWDSFGQTLSGKPITARWLIKFAKEKNPDKETILDDKDFMDTARKFIEINFTTEDGVSLIKSNGAWYKNVGTHYQVCEDDVINAKVWKWLETCRKHGKDNSTLPFKPSSPKVAGIMGALQAISIIENTSTPHWLNDRIHPVPSEVISMANGLLHIPTRKLIPHTVSYFNVNSLPYNWVGSGEPTQFIVFLKSIWGDDIESIETLQEIIGYLVTGDTSQQKIFFIKGPKRSGKGTLGRVLYNLIGAANVVSPQLSSLVGGFGLQPLIDKLLAIFPDARLNNDGKSQVVVERLLMISGEDSVTVDRKNITSWTGKMTSRILFFSNEVLNLRDTSGALAGRFIALSMNKTFFGNEDIGLTDKLLAELPQILNWALDGYERLGKRGYFKQPESGLMVMEEIEEVGSPLTNFVRNKCELGENFSVLKSELYDAYSLWCNENGTPTNYRLAPNNFGRKICDAYPSLRTSRPRSSNPGRQEKYTGIRIAPALPDIRDLF